MAARQPETKSISDIFISFAADAAERFPEHKSNIVIVDMNEERIYAVARTEGKKNDLTVHDASPILDESPDFIEMQNDTRASSISFHDVQRKTDFIFVNNRVNPDELDAVSRETESTLLFTLDHELAHMTIRDGNNNGGGLQDIVLAECVADAYALLRHYQRFGADEVARDLYTDPLMRADRMIFHRDRYHFTTFVLEEINKRRDLIDLENLSPQQTADLARRFALEYTPAAATLQDLYEAFKPVRKAAAPRLENGIRTLVDITLAPDCDYNTFKLGSLWLNAFLETRATPHGKTADLPDDYLDAVGRKLKEKEFSFEAENIFFNMPAPQAHKAPSRRRAKAAAPKKNS